MPIYEYECPNGHGAEIVRSMSARNEPIPCEDCNDVMIRRGIEPVSPPKLRRGKTRKMRAWR